MFPLTIILPFIGLAAAEPFWVVSFASLLSTRLDPVVSPGAVSGHVHSIIGASNFGPVYDYDDLQKSKCTTANVAIDKSNYWMPQLYRKTKDGLSLVQLSFSNVYYLIRRQKNEFIHPFSKGFRMTAGDPSRTTFNASNSAHKAVNFVCLYGKPDSYGFPKYTCENGLRAQVFFPNCWDGVNNWLEGSKHVAYPAEGNFDGGGKCPSTHPKRIVSLSYEFIFNDNDPDYASLRLAWVWANGDTTGYGLHADFQFGWPEDTIQSILDQGEACNVEFSLEKCPVLAPHRQTNGGSCSPEKYIVDEIITPVSKLPGNNPLYGTGGPNRPAYTETAKFKQIGPSKPASGRALTAASQATDDLTPTKCITFCSGKGYQLAGIEYGRECYCGNSLTGTSETADPTAQCGNVCSGEGNSKGFCGGGRTLTLYKYNGSGAPSVGAPSGGATIQPQPQTIKQVKATTIRQGQVKGDTGYPNNNKVITVNSKRSSRSRV